jgi:hypothetical protein
VEREKEDRKNLVCSGAGTADPTRFITYDFLLENTLRYHRITFQTGKQQPRPYGTYVVPKLKSKKSNPIEMYAAGRATRAPTSSSYMNAHKYTAPAGLLDMEPVTTRRIDHQRFRVRITHRPLVSPIIDEAALRRGSVREQGRNLRGSTGALNKIYSTGSASDPSRLLIQIRIKRISLCLTG